MAECCLSLMNSCRQSMFFLMTETIKVLPLVLFIDDNIDKNRSSDGAKKNFHGATMIVLQFPTIEHFGQQRQKK